MQNMGPWRMTGDDLSPCIYIHYCQDTKLNPVVITWRARILYLALRLVGYYRVFPAHNNLSFFSSKM